VEGVNLLDHELSSVKKMSGKKFVYYDYKYYDKYAETDQVIDTYCENYDKKLLVKNNYQGVK